MNRLKYLVLQLPLHLLAVVLPEALLLLVPEELEIILIHGQALRLQILPYTILQMEIILF